MTELLTAAQMRAIEKAAIDSGQVTGLELMERAGQGVVEAIFEEWPELKKTNHRAVVLCGPGNNGGDGFVVARLLKEWGWEVEVFLYGDAEKLPADARVNYERWVEVCPKHPVHVDTTTLSPPYDLRVDAVFGIGLKRPPTDNLSIAFSHTRQVREERGTYHPPKRVAIDCPSCLDLNTGKALIPRGIFEGDVHLDYYADLTVSFHRAKVGHKMGDGPEYCRKLKIVDIELEKMAPENAPLDWFETHAENENRRVVDVSPTYSDQLKIDWPSNLIFKHSAHKFSHGHALIASGPATKTGAARLAARGALRIGAGLVTVASPASAQHENAAHLTAIMLRVADTAEEFQALLSDDRISSVCIGPGFARVSESGGLDFEHTRQMVKTVLSAAKNTVLDADALSAFADAPDDLFQSLRENCVLTPHTGEFKRLFPDIHEKLTAPATKGPAYSKVDATRDAAARAGCVVLFKGADTVIANPQGRASINAAHYDRAAPWLATAGSGDVLAGFITGLLARGLDPMQAAETAAYLHVDCALQFGPGLIAEDIAEQLPAVFRNLGL